MKELHSKVQAIHKKVCLHVVLKNSQIEDIFRFSLQQLKTLDKADCAEYAFMVAQHALYIQKEINTTLTYKQWLQKNQRYFVDDADKIRITQLMDHLNIQYSELQHIVQRVEYLSKCLTNLSFSRRTQ